MTATERQQRDGRRLSGMHCMPCHLRFDYHPPVTLLLQQFRLPLIIPARNTMPVEPWNEVGKTWDDNTGLLDDEQIARCARAEKAETLRAWNDLPVMTRCGLQLRMKGFGVRVARATRPG